MAAPRLDIFKTLSALDRRDFNFLDSLDDPLKKTFAPPVVLRWASVVENDTMAADWYVCEVNRRANVGFWEIGQEVDLQWRLMASCGIGQEFRHGWLAGTGKALSPQLDDFVRLWHPDANDDEISFLLSRMTGWDIDGLLEDAAIEPERAKRIRSDFAIYSGEAPIQSKGKTKK